jgi:hypothetical protein
LPIDTCKKNAVKDIFNEEEARPEFIQAIAEAVYKYKQDPNKTPVLPHNVAADALKAQTEHLEEDPWVQLIDDYLSKTNRDRVNVLCIWEEGFNQDGVLQKRADVNRMLTILRNDITGWHEAGKKRIDDHGRGAICFERDTERLQEMSPSVTNGTGFEPVGDTTEIPF